MNGAALVQARYDIAVVGAGPVGSVCALAHARKGARVALLEANPKGARRLAGEWLHPTALRMLRNLEIDFDARPNDNMGKGFVVFPEDHSEPIVLPYPDGTLGLAYEHEALISKLHAAVENESGVDFYLGARVRSVEDGQLTFALNGTMQSLPAARIVGADGRASVVRQSLGLNTKRMTCSRMVGLVAEGATLPYEGYGHVVLGGPGPIFMFRLGAHRVRIIADVPLNHWNPRDRVSMLSESYASLIPESVRSGFVEALREGKYQAAANELRPRLTYGNSRRVLIGDAAGHYHPLTAVGMTLGFGDALTLADAESFDEFVAQRSLEIRAPEILAMGLYEVFADHRMEASALRQTIYRNWRANPKLRDQAMNLLACEDTSLSRLGLTFYTIVVRTVVGTILRSYHAIAWHQARDIVRSLAVRVGHFLRGVRELRNRADASNERAQRAQDNLARAFLTTMPSQVPGPRPSRPSDGAAVAADTTLQRATQRLLSLQDADGAWEGEMVWCPMLTAQYVLLHHIIDRPLPAERRRLVLRQFERTQLEGGVWGLHAHSSPYLFVTTLVYVAARLLGVEPDDALIQRAGRFIRAERVSSIPSWGKFWLALLNLWDWRGVNPVVPELWRLPRWLPLHPSNWYCHTRLIYAAMAAVYSNRFQTPVTPLIAALRGELFPDGFANVNFPASRNRLRDGDLYARPSIWLRAGYGMARAFERVGPKGLRGRCVEALIRHIRWELRHSNHASISPVSGFLNILALWLRDPNDADCDAALAQLEGWIWEDEAQGTRVTGARSVTWDTGFALQALATAPNIAGVQEALRRGAGFLRRQQITDRFAGFREAYRADPKGGWCFPGAWHGWPVSDCTAEAVLGIVSANPEGADSGALRDAVQFMLRSQNANGGFGSYESKRSRVSLEWLNPAEMFADSMTEHSYVECTASCLAALAACKAHSPEVVDQATTGAIARANAWLRRTQASDGSWRGAWGVQFIYGTYFGIKGLIAAEASLSDPAVRLACQWLLDRQHNDGGWGEHHSGCVAGHYVAHEESQVIHTAWALIALLQAGDPNWTAISRGAQFLTDTQSADGTWPRQDMAGVFFRTALLDYVLYRQYFPLHALGLYERRRLARQPAVKPPAAAAAAG